MLNTDSPYLIDDYRCMFLLSGNARIVVNLKEYNVCSRTIVFVTPGTIIEPKSVSEDIKVYGLGVSSEVFHLALNNRIPEIFNGQNKEGMQPIEDQKSVEMLCTLFETLLMVSRSANASEEVKMGVVNAIANYYNDLFKQAKKPELRQQPAANDIFDRFIYLVNQNCRQHRQLDFYAQKICVTERYLGTVVRKVSGVTAKDWIDQAVISAAKVMLRHSKKQIGQIADELSFPNASFFCKYFKRLTGITPQEYRTEK